MEQPQDHPVDDAGNESAAVAAQLEPITNALQVSQSAIAVSARDADGDPSKSARSELKHEESPREAVSKSQLHSANVGERLLLQPKEVATPRTTTPRNLVFPEPSDAQIQELPIAKHEQVYGERGVPVADDDDDDMHDDTKDDRYHDQQLQRPNIPLSARKYLTPRKIPVDGTENAAHVNDQSITFSTSMDTATTNRRHHPRRRVAPPRSFYGKLRFNMAGCCQSFMQAIRSIWQESRHVSVQQKIAYILILIGILSESATPAPRYNVPIGIAIFMNAASHFDHRMVISGLCLAVLVDFVWLLRPQEMSFNGYFQVKYANYTHFCLGACAMIKVWLVFSTYFDLGPEPIYEADAIESPEQLREQQQPKHRHHPIWYHLKYFFPRKTYPRCSHLSFEVLMRTLALIWIHGICGITLFVLGILSAMLYSGKVQFRSMTFGAPLHLVMLFRSVTVLASYVVATQHMSYNGCLKLFGCHKIAAYDDDNNASDIVLKYNKRWLRRVQRAKALDGLVAAYFWLVFYSAFHSGQFFAGQGLTAVLVLTAILILVLDFWAPLLIMVVAKCGSLLHKQYQRGIVDVDPYYPNQLEWEEEENEADNDGSSSSSESSEASSDGNSEDSSYSSSSRSSSTSSGYSTTEAGIRQRRHQRRHRKDKKTQSSSKQPLLAPFKRQNSTPIVDADQLLASGGSRLAANSINSSRSSAGKGGGGIWVRHWHTASGRSYLVHSITGETVWEIVPQKKGAISDNTKFSARKISERTPVSARRQPYEGTSDAISARSILSPPTSDSDVVVTAVHSPRSQSHGPPLSARFSSRTANAMDGSANRGEYHENAILLNPEEFLLLWDALPDGGSFICRVSKIPPVQDLSRHLHLNHFIIASDGHNAANHLRTVHFYAAVQDSTPAKSSSTGRRFSHAQPQFFLGEFIFDSLSLKLFAKFRCPQQDAIVPFVKKLQLKEIVGSYAPCE